MSETPADVIRRAAEQMRADRESPFPAAVASWLESLNGIEFSERGPMNDELTHALEIARAYLGGASR